jgi:tellurite methyltransferase
MSDNAPPRRPSAPDLNELLGAIDIYLLDQILRGRIAPGMSLLDAGCGSGRNLVWPMRAGLEVCAADADPIAIQRVQAMARDLAPGLPAGNFRAEAVERMSFEDVRFDVVVSCAVLHFARDETHFRAMLAEMWRVLRPGGMFFARLASSIGMEGRAQPLGKGRYFLPDGSQRFLVDEATLLALGEELGGRLLDPIKTTNVQNLRCMTTWCLQKA